LRSNMNTSFIAIITAACGAAASAQDCVWTLRDPGLVGPGFRNYPSMAYDSGRSHSVLFGGIPQGGGNPTDTWDWDGGTSRRSRDHPPGSPRA
jgi:hypothetical protein